MVTSLLYTLSLIASDHLTWVHYKVHFIIFAELILCLKMSSRAARSTTSPKIVQNLTNNKQSHNKREEHMTKFTLVHRKIQISLMSDEKIYNIDPTSQKVDILMWVINLRFSPFFHENLKIDYIGPLFIIPLSKKARKF